MEILSLLAQDELALVNFAPLAEHEPSLYQAFPSGPDRVLYGGPEQAVFHALSPFRLALDLYSLQKFICLWRNRYPVMYAPGAQSCRRIMSDQ